MSDLIFALQILLCGTGEGLTELSNLPVSHFSVAAAADRRDPPGALMLLPLTISQVLRWQLTAAVCSILLVCIAKKNIPSLELLELYHRGFIGCWTLILERCVSAAWRQSLGLRISGAASGF